MTEEHNSDLQSLCIIANREDYEEVAGLIKQFYATPGNEVGGPLHAVIEDLNTDDIFVYQAIASAAMTQNWPALALGQLLRDMSIYDRSVAIYKFWETRGV